MNINKHSKGRAVGLSCFSVMALLLGVAVFCPFNQAEETYAAPLTAQQTFDIDFVLQKVQATTINIDFYLNTALSIELNNLNTKTEAKGATPSGQAVFGRSTFGVGSNSSSGYNIYIYGKNGTNLLSDKGGEILALESDKTGNEIPEGYWGYNLSRSSSENVDTPELLTYHPIATSMDSTSPANSGSITVGDSDSEGSEEWTLFFGAKVGWKQKAGVYENTVDVQVVADPTRTVGHFAYAEAIDAVLDYQEEEARKAAERLALTESQ